MVESRRIWKVLAAVLFSATIPYTLGNDIYGGHVDDVDVESWVSKDRLLQTNPVDYEHIRKSIMAMPLTKDEAGMLDARRANPPTISSKSRVELTAGMFKTPMLKYPPKYFQSKLKHLIKLQNRQDKKAKAKP